MRTNFNISFNPLVINADLAFKPKPRPSEIPAAIAIIFFKIPPSETPIGSELRINS